MISNQCSCGFRKNPKTPIFTPPKKDLLNRRDAEAQREEIESAFFHAKSSSHLVNPVSSQSLNSVKFCQFCLVAVRKHTPEMPDLPRLEGCFTPDDPDRKAG